MGTIPSAQPPSQLPSMYPQITTPNQQQITGPSHGSEHSAPTKMSGLATQVFKARSGVRKMEQTAENIKLAVMTTFFLIAVTGLTLAAVAASGGALPAFLFPLGGAVYFSSGAGMAAVAMTTKDVLSDEKERKLLESTFDALDNLFKEQYKFYRFETSELINNIKIITQQQADDLLEIFHAYKNIQNTKNKAIDILNQQLEALTVDQKRATIQQSIQIITTQKNTEVQKLEARLETFKQTFRAFVEKKIRELEEAKAAAKKP